MKRANAYYPLFVFSISVVTFFVAFPGMVQDLKLWQSLLVVSFWFPIITLSVAALRYLDQLGPWKDRRGDRDQTS